MKIKMLCAVMAVLAIVCVSLSACSVADTNPQDEVVNEFLTEINNKVDFEYDLSAQKMDSAEKFISMIGEIYSSIPAFEDSKSINSEYVCEYFKTYYTSIDPDSAEIVKGEDGREYARVNVDRIKSLLFFTFRVEDFEMPTKEENPDFYGNGGSAYILKGEKSDAVYHATDVSNETESVIEFVKVSGKADIDSFRAILVEDEFGYYISSITK